MHKLMALKTETENWVDHVTHIYVEHGFDSANA